MIRVVRSRVGARRLVTVLQLALVTIFAMGVVLLNVSVIVNAVFALAVTLLPAVLKRDYDVHLEPLMVLWITTAAFLHSLGMVGVYETVWWWDHLTHAFSGALVAAVGYAATRAVDAYAEEIRLPPTFLWVFVFLVTVAVGVGWETTEMLGRELARLADVEPLLVVYGVDDTILDLVFDIVGATLVAALTHLGGGRVLVDDLTAALERQRG